MITTDKSGARNIRGGHGVSPKTAKLTPQIVEIFASQKSCAISFVGALEKMPLRLGDNEGGCPFFVLLSSSWADTAGPAIDRASPTCAMGLLFRFWAPSREAARRIEIELPLVLASMTAKLRGRAYNLKAGVQLDDLKLEVLALGERLGIELLGDDELIARLSAVPKMPIN